MLMKEKASAILADDDYVTEILTRKHRYFTDEPHELGGQDMASTPQELLLGSLASCVATTLRMYAKRKGWDLGIIEVDVTMNSIHTVNGAEFEFTQHFNFSKSESLTEAQLERLAQIAKKCPVAQIIQKTSQLNYVMDEHVV